MIEILNQEKKEIIVFFSARKWNISAIYPYAEELAGDNKEIDGTDRIFSLILPFIINLLLRLLLRLLLINK